MVNGVSSKPAGGMFMPAVPVKQGLVVYRVGGTPVSFPAGTTQAEAEARVAASPKFVTKERAEAQTRIQNEYLAGYDPKLGTNPKFSPEAAKQVEAQINVPLPKPAVPEQRVETDLPENMGLPRPLAQPMISATGLAVKAAPTTSEFKGFGGGKPAIGAGAADRAPTTIVQPSSLITGTAASKPLLLASSFVTTPSGKDIIGGAGTVAGKVGAGISQVGKALPVTTILPRPPAEAKKADVTLREALEQSPVIIKESGKTYLRGETKAGEPRFVQVPFSETEFIKASESKQPFETFKAESLKSAEQVYNEEVQKIAARGEIPEAKSEYLSRVEKDITPALQEKLIKQQYIPTAIKYAQENIEKLPVITKSQLTEQQELSTRTEFFKKELKAGTVPARIEMLTITNVGVSSTAAAAGALKALGRTEAAAQMKEVSTQKEAELLAQASLRGETALGTLQFGLEQIPETYTGIAGASLLLGAGVGAVTKAALPVISKGAIAGGTKIAGAISKASPLAGGKLATAGGVAKGIGTEVSLLAKEYPLAARLAVASIPVGIEAAAIYGRAEAGVPLPQQVETTAKEITEITAFGYGFKKGLAGETGVTYSKAEYLTPKGLEAQTKALAAGQKYIPKAGEKITIGRAVGFEEGGKKLIVASQIEGKPWQFGAPVFETAPKIIPPAAYIPRTATEAEIVKRAFSATGGKESVVTEMSAIQSVMKSIAGGPASLKPNQFVAESKYLTQEQNQALTEIVKKHAAKYEELYGSQAQKMQLPPELQREAADVDILARLRTEKAAKLAQDMVKELRAEGIPAYISPEKETLIMLKTGAKNPPHLIDLHSIDEPTPDVIVERAYGFKLTPETFKVEGVRTSQLFKEGLRKSASVGTLRDIGGETVLAPEAHRAKDIADVVRISRGIQAGYELTGQPAKAVAVGKAVTGYVAAYPQVAQAVAKGEISSIAVYASPVSGISSASIGQAAMSLPNISGISTRAGALPSASAAYKPSAVIASVSASLSSRSALSSAASASSQLSSLESYSKYFSPKYSPSAISPSPSISVKASSYSPPSSRIPSYSPSLPPSYPSSPSFSAVSSLPSLSQSASSSYSPSSGAFPVIGPKGGTRTEGQRAESKVPKGFKYKPSKRIKTTRSYGIISEGISKRLFGKATLGRKRGSEEISAPTAELQRAGLTPATFLERGGFVTQDGGKLSTGMMKLRISI